MNEKMMNDSAQNLLKWRASFGDSSIDGLIISMAHFCTENPSSGVRLAITLRNNDQAQIGEWMLSCLAELFSKTWRENDILMTSVCKKFTAKPSGRTGTFMAWSYEKIWDVQDMDEHQSMDDGVMYLTGYLDTPHQEGTVVSVKAAQSEMIQAAYRSYFGSEEVCQRMLGSPECLARIGEAIEAVLEPLILEERLGPRKEMEASVSRL
jgi:hypothetical protein